jgi:hypothetical protein
MALAKGVLSFYVKGGPIYIKIENTPRRSRKRGAFGRRRVSRAEVDMADELEARVGDDDFLVTIAADQDVVVDRRVPPHDVGDTEALPEELDQYTVTPLSTEAGQESVVGFDRRTPAVRVLDVDLDAATAARGEQLEVVTDDAEVDAVPDLSVATERDNAILGWSEACSVHGSLLCGWGGNRFGLV